ncbi:hypothetical protein [Fodinicola feengrottensis]
MAAVMAGSLVTAPAAYADPGPAPTPSKPPAWAGAGRQGPQ